MKRYTYYVQPIGETEKAVTRKELTNILNRWCVKRVHNVGCFGIDATDEKKVRSVLRAITVGNCHAYLFVGLGSVRARAEKD